MHTSTFSSGAFVNLIHPEVDGWLVQIRRLKQLTNLGHAEIWAEMEPSVKEAELLRKELGEIRTSVHAPFIGLALASPWAQLREISLHRIEGVFAVARQLRVETVTLHTGTVPAFDPHEAVFERLVTVADELIELAAEQGLKLGFENMPARAGTSVEPLAHLNSLDDLAHALPRVSFTLDIGHAIQNGDDWADFLRSHSERIVDVHLHDGRQGGEAHLSLGQGELPIDKCALILSEIGYRGLVSLETLGWEATLESWLTWQRVTEQVAGTLG